MLDHQDKGLIRTLKGMDDDWTPMQKLSLWWNDSWIYSIYEYSWAYKLRWFLKHWWKHDNWVKTNLPISYQDKDRLMEDAIFSLVEKYVAKDQEDAFSNVVVEGDERSTMMEIIHFYRIRKPELQEIGRASCRERV